MKASTNVGAVLMACYLVAWLDRRTIGDVIRQGLHESLTHVVDSVHGIGEAVHKTFFAAEVKPPPPRFGQSQTLGAVTQSQG